MVSAKVMTCVVAVIRVNPFSPEGFVSNQRQYDQEPQS